MGYDIKLDGINKIVGAGQTTTQREATHHAGINKPSATVTASMSTMAKQLLAENNTTEREQRILELKARVDSQQYRLDLDQLTEKLSRSLFSIK